MRTNIAPIALLLLVLVCTTSLAVAQIVPPPCRCGDVNGDDMVGRGDVLELREFLTELRSDVTAPEKCAANASDHCDLVTLVVLRRALARRAPGISQSCSAALDPSCPLPDQPVDTVCPAHPLPPAAFPSVCEVDSVGGAGIRLRGTILGPGGILRGGEVLVDESGEIACTGCDCSSAPGADDASVVTCGEGVISPGLINPLARSSYAQNDALTTPTEDYDHRHEWRFGTINKVPISVVGGAGIDAQRAYELRHLMAGTTSMSRGTTPGLTRDLDSTTNDLGLTPARIVSFPLGDIDGTMLVSDCDYPDPIQSDDVESDPGILFDVAQGIAPEARNEFVCLSQSPSDLFSLPMTRPSPSGLGAVDGTAYGVLRDAGSVPHLTLRSDGFLYGNGASIAALHASGVPFALATDWPRTGSFSQLRELACADAINQDQFDGLFSDRDLWLAVTANAALATVSETRIGTLQPGRIGDIAVFDGRLLDDYRAVIEADTESVVLVLRAGIPLYGEAPLMLALGDEGCEAINVCGEARRVCITSEFGPGTSLDDLASALTEGPLADCGDVPQPACGFARSEYSGVPTPDDLDGDGIANAIDLCPTIFDPVRPADGGSQADVDDDGRGDACDPCPVDAADDCDLIFAADIDHDGEMNETDNCPGEFNPAQEDTDGDSIGDACATPTNSTLPISAVRNPSAPLFPGFDTDVTIEDLYVTAVLPDGSLFVQSDELLPWTGIFLFRPMSSAAVRGNGVDVRGTLTDYFGLVELVDAIVEVTDAGTALPFAPLAVEPSTIATGGSGAASLESMLLQVGPVTITNANPDVPDDLDRFEVTGGLLIDDRAFPQLDNLAPTGTVFESIRGVLDRSLSENHLLPRDPDDVTTTAAREVALLEPTSASIPILGSLELTVSLTLPAPPGGELVSLSIAGTGSIPASVVVPDGEYAASFTFTAGASTDSVIITATLGESFQQAALNVVEPMAGGLVINEVDYDQPSIDTAEFVEIYNASLSPVDLENAQLSFINGSNGAEYLNVPLANAGSLASGAYLVVGAASVTAVVPPGVATITMAGSIQNGSPDGLALIDPVSQTVFDVLSYEGSIHNADVPGMPGPVDLVEGQPAVAEDEGIGNAGSLVRLPNGFDTDDAANDWSLSETPTPGSANF